MTLLATAIARVPHLAAFDKLVANRFENIDLSCILMYLIDQVPAVALPILGEQFDVMGFKGWDLCATEEQKRELIKNAIELHRYKGTPWSIKQALRAVGFGEVEIEEGVSAYYDGEFVHDGTIDYGGDSWALFKVFIDLGNLKGLNAAQTALITLLINEYKPVRCHLAGLSFKVNLSDSGFIADVQPPMSMTLSGLQERLTPGIIYDGTANYDGTYRYNNDPESLIMNMSVLSSGSTMPILSDSLTVNVLNSRGEIIQTIPWN